MVTCSHINQFDSSKLGLRRDLRFLAILEGLSQLTCVGLLRVLAYNAAGRVLYDGGNFDPASRTWCPLAIGIGIADWTEAHVVTVGTDALAKSLIIDLGRHYLTTFHLNPVSGIDGRFYRDDRAGDLRVGCETLLRLRGRCYELRSA
ncbi:MAG: hypothetical protein ABI779_00215 [Acidobacteriota bacterium]